MAEFSSKKFFENLEESSKLSFSFLCDKIKNSFFDDWDNRMSASAVLELQKKAIIGYEKEKKYFLNRIESILKSMNLDSTSFPDYYPNLCEAIYEENWGLAGLSEWFSDKYKESSSAKIIGQNIYFLDNGKMKLMKQTISDDRKMQLVKSFLLNTEERMEKDYYEIYMLDGTRVTIFLEPMAKKGQSALIFRRYLIPNLTFEEQARRGTIPYEAINLFKAMVKIGFNVVFLGAVRSAKTTFLSTWQSYEDPSLEGVLIETDPEIPMQKLLPNAPILQLIADGERLKTISKNLLRSDADYFILAEARDGIALDTALKLASKGTKRMKLTFHSRNPKHFPLEAASEIVKSIGGDLNMNIKMVASGFDYLFHFVQLSDKRKKRLKGIYQMTADADGTVSVRNIMKYDPDKESWTFINEISEDKEEYARFSDSEAFEFFKNELRRLSLLGEIR